jgi:hypothetical protein
MSNGSTKPIKYVRVGDQVMTPNGARRVAAVHDNGIKEVWQIATCNAILLATANHEVMTQAGWKRVDALTQACDTVYFYQEVTSWRSTRLALILKPLFLMVRNTIAILKVQTLRIANILAEQATGFIATCGFTTMARCQMGTTSITLTATQATTTYQTLSAYHAQSIGICIGKSDPTLASSLRSWRTLRQSVQKLLPGISRKRVGHGTVNTFGIVLQKFGASLKRLKKLSSLAFGAAHWVCAKLALNGFVVLLAKRLNQNSGLVKQAINTHTMRHVYDLTVEGEHCYYANGILVHNCDALSQALRVLRDMNFIEIDPVVHYDDEYDEDRLIRRQNPYAM